MPTNLILCQNPRVVTTNVSRSQLGYKMCAVWGLSQTDPLENPLNLYYYDSAGQLQQLGTKVGIGQGGVYINNNGQVINDGPYYDLGGQPTTDLCYGEYNLSGNDIGSRISYIPATRFQSKATTTASNVTTTSGSDVQKFIDQRSFTDIDDMFNMSPLAYQVGEILQVNATNFLKIDSSDIEENNFRALNCLSIRDFGAKLDYYNPDGSVNLNPTDDSDAWDAAMESNYPIYFPSGWSKMTRQLVIPTGKKIYGEGSEAYGEQQHKKYGSTIIFDGINANEWAVKIPSEGRGILLNGMGFRGDWLMNGVQFESNNREIDFIDVSVKSFNDGMTSDDIWVSVFDRLSVTARGVGVSTGKGTTIEWRSIRLQGDKTNGIRITRGMEFRDATKLQNSKLSGFCQYSYEAIYIEGSPTLDINGFDWEENSTSCIHLVDCDELRLNIESCSALLQTGSSFIKVSGSVSGSAKVYIKNLGGLTKHFSNQFNGALDWSTERFIEDDNASFSNEAVIVIEDDFFDTIKDGIDPTAIPWIKKSIQANSDFRTLTGTFTPTVSGSSTAGDASYSIRNGSYNRVGTLVFFSIQVAWTNHTGAGDMLIGGLPFGGATQDATFNPYNFELTFSGDYLTAIVFSGNTDIELYNVKSGTFGSKVQIDTEATISISGVYSIA